LITAVKRTGAWHVRGPQTVWRLDGIELGVNAKSVSILDGPHWSAPIPLSGQRLVTVSREYAEAYYPPESESYQVRRPVICESAAEITLTFPRLPLGLLHMVKRLQAFAEPFVLEIDLFSAWDPMPLATFDRQFYYGPVGGWKEGSALVYENGVLVSTGFVIDHELGYVWFNTTRPVEVEVTASFTWSPLVALTTPITETPVPVPDRKDLEIEIGIKLQELRGSRTTVG
jgi:hypothetical protein